MSRTWPGHVLWTGTYHKFPGTESDGQPYFLQNFFVTCPSHVQSKARVKYSKKTKKKRMQISQIFQILEFGVQWIDLNFNLKRLGIFMSNGDFILVGNLLDMSLGQGHVLKS